MIRVRRILGIGLLMFLASLIVLGIAGRILNVDLKVSDPSSLPLSMWIIGIVSTFFLSIAGLSWYFASSSIVASAKTGLLLGLFMLVFGLVLDGIALIPYSGGLDIYLKYFAKWEFWATYGVIVAASIIVGAIKARSEGGGRVDIPL